MRIKLLILFIFCTLLVMSQNKKNNDNNEYYISEIKCDTLLDKQSENKYIIDKDRKTITAIDKKRNILWKTNPYKDSFLDEYRVKNPFIIKFKFLIINNKEVIYITYNNSVFGFILKTNGKFYWEGRD
jgi:hypothetical protein